MLLPAATPGYLRNGRGHETDFGFASFGTRVDSSSPRHATIVLGIAEAHGPQGVLVPEHADLGGCSGGPVFQLHEKPITSLQLVGFCYEYGSNLEIILSRHGSAMRADGTLDESRA